MNNASTPAILGGTPSRSVPYPKPNFIGSEERRLVSEVLDTGILSDYVAHNGPSFNGGRMVKALEEEFSLISALIEARTRAGLTQEQVARRMKTTQGVIARLESGGSKPSTRTLERFAQATGSRLKISFEPEGART